MKTSHLLACITVFCFVALSSQQYGGYKELTPKEVYKKDAAKGALKFGADAIIAKLIKQNKIPKGDYKIEKILYADQQVVEGINYKFKVIIADDCIEIIAEYAVFRNLKGKYSLTSSDYHIKKDKKEKKDKKDEKKEDKKEDKKDDC